MLPSLRELRLIDSLEFTHNGEPLPDGTLFTVFVDGKEVLRCDATGPILDLLHELDGGDVTLEITMPRFGAV